MAGSFRSGSYHDDTTGFVGVANNGTVTVAVGTALSAGDTIFLGIVGLNALSGDAAPTYAVSDSVNGSWGSAEKATKTWVVVGLNVRTSLWAFSNSAAGTPTMTVTMASTGGTFGGGLLTGAASGLATSSAFDTGVGASGTGASPTSGAVSPATGASGEFMVTMYLDAGEGTTLTKGNIDGVASVLAGKHDADGGHWQGLFEYVDPAHTIASSATPAGTATSPGAPGGWGMLSAVFKVTGGAAVIPPGLGPVVGMPEWAFLDTAMMR